MSLSRRLLLASGSAVLLSQGLRGQAPPTAAPPPSGLGSAFPTQDPDLVREMVSVAHGNLPRVKELVERRPALAKAAWDWGYGDWETALGAASHVGSREVAELLLARGAQPTIFAATMLGQLDVVKAFVAASPGIERILGPHGLTLLHHARAGGEKAKPVLDYLTAVGDADPVPVVQPLAPEERAKLLGNYRYGAASDEVMAVGLEKDQLTIQRAGRTARRLTHTGGLEFFPSGAPAVKVRFATTGSDVRLEILDPDVVLSAAKS